ncbi:TlpA family protein disulfide reductase [Streptacidiphilus albus]|uniref:TlpA family protein disulfide reductase n=1 Tax=Streptacidiphilus albus TaxID=105425 RepID=UPI00068D6E3F|nr:TlpA disulfide reductase family protein [Streptacidiphilus albus]
MHLRSTLAHPPRPGGTGVRAAVAVGALALGLVLSGCSGSSSGNAVVAVDQQIPGFGEVTTMAVGHRGDPVDLVGKDLDGKPLSLASYRGKVVVVNVWNSGCAPCRAEAAGFEAVYRSDRSQGVQFLGIDTRDLQLPPAQQFVKAEGLTYPDFYDPGGSVLLQFPVGSVAPQATPSTLVIDRQGRIAARVLDSMTQAELAQVVAPVLAEKS